jgi:hypothetical protein
MIGEVCLGRFGLKEVEIGCVVELEAVEVAWL